MKSTYKYLLLIFLGVAVLTTSCLKDLDTIPLDPDVITSAIVYDDPASYKKVLAKLYAGLAVSGQQGPDGQPDISGIDEGFSTYLRQYWKAQELSTDEAVIAWNDGNIHDYHQQDWDANNEFVTAMYNRIFYQITLCNEFIRETTDEKLVARNVPTDIQNEVSVFRAEARFLRALSYWHALDMFRNVPFVTEEDEVGAFFPTQTNAQDLFLYIEAELKDIENTLVAAKQNEYGRVDQAAAWMLLAKAYLNAEVHIGQAKYTECLTYCQKVIDAGFSLQPEYAHLFVADNHISPEIIFPIAFDGVNTRTWGGMTFVVHAAVGGNMDPAAFGIDGGWGGTRTTSALVNKFPATSGGSALVTPNEGNSATYPSIYTPGGHQGWDPATAAAINSVANDGTYEGYQWFPTGNEFKFTLFQDWTVDWGDDNGDGTLEVGGANIVIPNDGFYKINVDTTNLTYTLTSTKWGLIGSATADGWNSDQDMTYDATENAWVISTNLVAGEAKFRANDDWAINLGDDNTDGILTDGGANITIPADGNYLIKLFIDKPDYTYSIEQPSFDTRAMFHTDGQNLEIADITQFTEGYAITKFKNVTATGGAPSDLTFIDTDFPLFRLADVYLMYAEAVLRGGSGGDISTALGYVNQVRERAYQDQSGNLTQSELTLEFLLDERARELYWECHRRTDLVRFGQFTNGTYLWPWKGGVAEGQVADEFYDVFPIPASDIGANPNLTQNTGY